MLHLLQQPRLPCRSVPPQRHLRRRGFKRVVLTGADLGPLVRFCRDHKASIETLLGGEVRSDVETKPVQQLGAVLKLVGLRLKAAGSKKRSGVKTYSYQVDARSWGRLTKVVEARRQTKSWESLYQRQGWDPEECLREEKS